MRRLVLVFALALLALPASAGTWLNINYAGTANANQTLDLYTPPGAGPWPVVVLIHGGSWVGGNKSNLTYTNTRFTSRGWAVANINYRLSPYNVWPTHLYDCKAAVRWVRGNALTYGLSSTRIVAVGFSAGAHLAAMLGTTNGQAAYKGSVGQFQSYSSDVAAVVDNAGPSDLLTASGQLPATCPPLTYDPFLPFLGCSVATCPDKAADASPALHVTAAAPPFRIVHGDADCTVPPAQSAELATALGAAGVAYEAETLAGVAHTQGPFFESARMDSMIAFLEAHVP